MIEHGYQPGRRVRAVILGWLARSIRWTGWAAALLAVAGALVGGAVPMVDLASHFRIQYALAIAAGLAAELTRTRRRWWRSGVLAVALVFDASSVAALALPAGNSAPALGSPPIRLIQFNTWPENREPGAVVAFIESERPDACTLQETAESLRRAVAERLSGRYRVLEAGADLVLIRRNAGPIEFVGWGRHRLPGGTSIEARLRVGGRPVALLGLHATAPLGFGATRDRDAQLAWVGRWSRSREGAAIVLGDLNATHWSHPFRALLVSGRLVDSARGFGPQPTWRSRYGPVAGPAAAPFRIPIDHCLHSSDLATVARRTGPACGSNHLPLLVTLRFVGAGGTGG